MVRIVPITRINRSILYYPDGYEFLQCKGYRHISEKADVRYLRQVWIWMGHGNKWGKEFAGSKLTLNVNIKYTRCCQRLFSFRNIKVTPYNISYMPVKVLSKSFQSFRRPAWKKTSFRMCFSYYYHVLFLHATDTIIYNSGNFCACSRVYYEHKHLFVFIYPNKQTLWSDSHRHRLPPTLWPTLPLGPNLWSQVNGPPFHVEDFHSFSLKIILLTPIYTEV